MTLALQDCLWDLLESEAFERYFINDAEKPAFLILHKYNPLSHGSFELFMNHVSRLCRVKTQKQVIEKLDKILSSATIKITVFKQKKKGLASFGKKELYATVDPSLPVKPEHVYPMKNGEKP